MNNYIITLTNGSKASVKANNAHIGDTGFNFVFDGGSVTFDYPIADVQTFECIEEKQNIESKPVMNIEAEEVKRPMSRRLIDIYLDELYLHAIANRKYNEAVAINNVQSSNIKFAPYICTVLSSTDKDKMLEEVVSFYNTVVGEYSGLLRIR